MAEPFLTTEERGWNADAWLGEFSDFERSFEQSVVEAADENCILSAENLERLFKLHGADHAEYLEDLEAIGSNASPVGHAVQALRFLGY